MANETMPFNSMERELQDLGDPSGRQGSQYWDEWFKIVSCRDHKPFEWYCNSGEVIRVLEYHLMGHREEASIRKGRMIHPGSGTSLVPIRLRARFPDHTQVIVDVSKVALEEIRKIHMRDVGQRDNDSTGVLYLACDLLQQSLPLENSSFDAWVDKGFVDAAFSEKRTEQNQEQSRRLFREINRILTDSTGVALIVSLAEEHSLRLVVDRWLEGTSPFLEKNVVVDGSDLSSAFGWSSTLHVWELTPVSGNMLPFGFVLQKWRTVKQPNPTIIWHNLHGKITKRLVKPSDSTFQILQEIIAMSREVFMRDVSLNESSVRSRPRQRQVMLVLEIKPYRIEDDLVLLGEQICSKPYSTHGKDLQPQWQPWTEDLDSLHQIVPIGYGVSKLLLRCLIASDDVDDLVEAIQEEHADVIQSVDVDWSSTTPVRHRDTGIPYNAGRS